MIDLILLGKVNDELVNAKICPFAFQVPGRPFASARLGNNPRDLMEYFKTVLTYIRMVPQYEELPDFRFLFSSSHISPEKAMIDAKFFLCFFQTVSTLLHIERQNLLNRLYEGSVSFASVSLRS